MGTLFVRLVTSSNIDQFSNFLSLSESGKFIIILSLKTPPHVKCVDTLLPCEMSSNNWKQDGFCNNTF